MKIVLNKCYGGFNISHAAMLRYAEIKGIELFYQRDERFSRLELETYWTVPEDERPKEIVDWGRAPYAERLKYNEDYDKKTIYPREIPRNDSALIQVVEELGEAANGSCAKLEVVEIPDGVEWQVTEYDGMESVERPREVWA